MSADAHLSPHQLSMFMAPHELAALPLSDDEGYGSQHILDKKYKQSHQRRVVKGVMTSLVDEVSMHGVQTPVTVYHDEDGSILSDGHHRLSVALHHRPDQLIPVIHEDEDNW